MVAESDPLIADERYRLIANGYRIFCGQRGEIIIGVVAFGKERASVVDVDGVVGVAALAGVGGLHGDVISSGFEHQTFKLNGLSGFDGDVLDGLEFTVALQLIDGKLGRIG